MSYKQLLIAGLKAKGWVQQSIPGQAHTSWVFKENKNPNRRLFVGEKGALRMGPCWSKSWSVGDPSRQTEFYTTVLEAGRKALPDGKEVVEEFKGF